MVLDLMKDRAFLRFGGRLCFLSSFTCLGGGIGRALRIIIVCLRGVCGGFCVVGAGVGWGGRGGEVGGRFFGGGCVYVYVYALLSSSGAGLGLGVDGAVGKVRGL